MAQDMVQFGASCGGTCDFRTITIPQGVIYLDETLSDLACPGSCHPNPAVPISATLTDVIVGGTGAFQGATGMLTGSVNAAGLESLVRLAGR